MVGVPNDRIKIVDKDLYLNGVKLSEPYVQHTTGYVDAYRDRFPSAEPAPIEYPGAIEMMTKSKRDGEIVVPPGYYFVLGDNRDRSLDSRYWGFVPASYVLGRPVLILSSNYGKVHRGERTMMPIPRIRIGAT